IIITRLALKSAHDPAPEHRHAAQHVWFLTQSEDRACDHEHHARTHEILTIAVTHAPCIDALLARSHRTQMHETQVRLVPAAGDPTMHPAAMSIDAVPHHLAHEATDRLEAGDPIELDHAKRHVVAVTLVDQLPVFLDIGLPAAGRDAWISRHALHQNLEIARWQTQVEVKL